MPLNPGRCATTLPAGNGAAAPFAFAATMEQFGIGASLVLSAALGSIGIVAFVAVAMTTKRNLVVSTSLSN